MPYHEQPDHTGKAPKHQQAAIRNKKNFSNARVELITPEVNKIHTKENWERLLYNALFNYCRDYFNIDNNVIIELKFKKSKGYGYVDLGKKNIITIENSSVDLNIIHILHEFTHIKQKLNNELTTKNGMLLWKNKSIISVKEYKTIRYEEHKNLPWEIEADASKNLLLDFYDSEYYQSLKGKDDNLDFIMSLRD